MPRNWETEFEDVGTTFYPGSSKRIPDRRKPAAPPEREGAWDERPKVYVVNGQNVDFFTVGQLATALNRQAVTVRKWENEGVIPKAQYSAPSEDPRGKRRLYTREQVQGIVRIATEEGLLNGDRAAIGQTNFTKRVIDLFAELKVPGT